MNNPVKAMLGNNCAVVYVWGAVPYIKQALRQDADVWVSVSDSVTERVLSHNAALRPLQKLPWPLSKVQAHHVRLTVSSIYDKSRPSFDQIYKWQDVDEAITLFLDRLPSNMTVRIMVS